MIALVAATAMAQVAPTIDAQLFRPTLDGRRFSWVDDAEKANPGPFFGLAASYARDPLLYVVVRDVSSSVVRDIVQTDLTGGWAFGVVRVGAVIPILARSTGWAGGETGLGDVAAAARVTVLSTEVVDLAIDGRLWLPTTTVVAPLGDRGGSGDIEAVVSADFGPVRLAMNNGYRALPRRALDGLAVDDVATSRLGMAIGSPVVGVTTELASQVVLRSPALATTPIEALLGSYVDPKGPIGLKMAIGHGITAAMGAPRIRGILALTFSSDARGPVDTDGDGLLDPDDGCPRDPEDRDAWQDDDGCPETPQVILKVVDENGRPVVSATAHVLGPNLTRTFAGSLELELVPGTYTVVAQELGYTDGQLVLTVTDGPLRTYEVVLHTQAVAPKRFEINGVILFETASDRLLPESERLLDQVADVLTATPSIELMRIVGHTDSRGTDEDNFDLSQRRAAAVRTYLIDQGIAWDRLVSTGKGESQPVVGGEDEVAHAANRRVEFYVEGPKP